MVILPAITSLPISVNLDALLPLLACGPRSPLFLVLTCLLSGPVASLSPISQQLVLKVNLEWSTSLPTEQLSPQAAISQLWLPNTRQ